MLAKDSAIIEIPEGQFIFDKSLILDKRRHVTIRGKGIEKTVLSFKAQTDGAEGIRISRCQNILLEDFTIEDAAGDNIKVNDTDGITFRNIRSCWTGEVNEDNGAYGLYPVVCQHVLIEGCEVIGASDAGIYVGQSDSVIIRNNKVYWNVAGIESENSTNVEIYNNEAYDNTGGILVFDLPGLTRYGRNIKVFNNKVYENNLRNFAPAGNIVGIVPPGTGVLILATRGVELTNNEITDNKTIGLGIVSYELIAAMNRDRHDEQHRANEGTQSYDSGYKSDLNYDPYPGGLNIHHNHFANSYTLPDLSNEFGKLFLSKFGLSLPDIAWDGILPETSSSNSKHTNAGHRICISEDPGVKMANLDAGNNFKGLTTDKTQFECADAL